MGNTPNSGDSSKGKGKGADQNDGLAYYFKIYRYNLDMEN